MAKGKKVRSVGRPKGITPARALKLLERDGLREFFASMAANPRLSDRSRVKAAEKLADIDGHIVRKTLEIKEEFDIRAEQRARQVPALQSDNDKVTYEFLDNGRSLPPADDTIVDAEVEEPQDPKTLKTLKAVND